MTEQEWVGCSDLWMMLEFLREKASDRKLRLLAVNACRRIWNLLSDERSRNAVLVAERFANGLADDADLRAARTQAADALKGVRAERSQHPSEFYNPFDAAAEAALSTVADVAFLPNDPELMRPRYDCFTSAIGGVGNAVAAKRLREAEASDPSTQNEDWLRLQQEDGAGQIWKEIRTREWTLQAQLMHCVFGPPLFGHFSVGLSSLFCNDATAVKLAQGIYEERAFDRLTKLADALEEGGCTDADILGHCRQPGQHIRGCWVVDLVLGKG